MVLVIAAVVRRRRVRKHHVVGDVVVSHSTHIECGGIKPSKNRGWIRTQIAQNGDHCDAEHVVAKPAPIRPTARHCPLAKALLYFAGQGVASENTEPIEARSSGQAGWTCREINLDKIRG